MTKISMERPDKHIEPRWVTEAVVAIDDKVFLFDISKTPQWTDEMMRPTDAAQAQYLNDLLDKEVMKKCEN